MTAEEIYATTPWEIEMLIRGLSDRQRYNRLIIARLVSLPVYNSGFNAPKRGYKLEDILPQEDFEDDISQNEIDKWREILKEAKNNGRYD